MRMAKKKSLFVLLILVAGSIVVLLLRDQKNGLQDSKDLKAIKRHSSLMRELKKFTQSIRERRKVQRTKICSHHWQEKYTKLHREIIQSKRPPNYLVFDCGGIGHGCGGYGNRIGAISSIFLLAVLTNRAFLINWKSNISIMEYLQPKSIDWNYSRVKLKGLTNRHHMWGKGFDRNYPDDTLLFQGNSKGEFLKWFKQTNFMKFFSYQVEKITGQWYFISGIWKNSFFWKRSRRIGPKSRGHKYSFIGCAYNFLFKRTPRFEKLLRQARQQLNWGNNAPRIGIHFRAGDFSFNKDTKSDSSVFVRLEKYFDCAKRLEKRLKDLSPSLDKSSLRWFLATDNIQVKQYAKKKYSRKVISLGVQVEHISAKEPSRAGLEGVLLDNVLLSECDILILSNSTFSNVALGMGFHSLLLNSFGDHCHY